jgi:hypothetical protein
MKTELFGPHEIFMGGFALAAAISMLALLSVAARSDNVAVVCWIFIALLSLITCDIYFFLRLRADRPKRAP